MESSKRLNLTVILERGSGQAAARESRARLTPEEWALLLEYSLHVVCLQEAEDQQREYWVAPRTREA